MIKSIHIQNYQSHSDSFFELETGVNAFIGQTDAGKSAIIRALRWVIFNRPTGDSFRSWDGGETKVTIVLHDGNEITRLKSKTQNLYLINGKELKAVGVKVPEEVSELLNMSEINIQHQFSSPFLLTSSPGEVAQYFNKIANLKQIDTSRELIASWIRTIDKNISIEEGKLEDAEVDIKAFDYIQLMEIELEVLEEMEGDVKSLNIQRVKIEGIIQEIKTLTSDIKKEQKKANLSQDINIIFNQQELLESYYKKLKELVTLITSIEVMDKILKVTKETATLSDPIEQLILLTKNHKKAKRNYESLSNLVTSVENVEKSIKKQRETKDTKAKMFKKNMPKICPLCNK